MNTPRIVLLLACCVAYHDQGAAQATDKCTGGTIAECFTQLYDAKSKPKIEHTRPTAAANNVDHALAASSSTPDTFGARVASTVNDYASLVGGLVQSTNISDDGTAVDFYFNPIRNRNYGFRLQFEASVQKPAVYEPLEQQLITAGSTAELDKLKKSLGDFDDALLAASWTLENKRIGRSADPFLPWIQDLSVASLFDGADALDRATQALTMAVNNVHTSHAEKWTSLPLEESLADFTAPDRKGLVVRIEELVDASIAFESKRPDANIARFAALLDSQPQLSVSAGYERRDDAVGPSDWFARFSFEYGFRNGTAKNAWRDLRRCFHGTPEKLGRVADDATKDRLKILASCFSNATNTDTSDLKRAFRVSVSGEYHGTPSTTLDLSSVGLSVPIPRDHTASLKFGLGWYVHFNPEAQDTGRVDMTAEAYDYGQDTRQNRVVATATYTIRISETAFVPIGVTWASKSEFVGDVTKRLSAHLGVTYRFAPKN